MHPWRKYLDWPLTPSVFPKLRELPEGEPRSRAIAAIRRCRNLTSVTGIFSGILMLIMVALAVLVPGLPHKFMDRFSDCVFAAVGVLYVLCILGIFLGPPLLNRKAIAKELAWLIDSGDLWTCAKCAYNLRGSTSPRCPECGTPISQEMQIAIRQHLERLQGTAGSD